MNHSLSVHKSEMNDGLGNGVTRTLTKAHQRISFTRDGVENVQIVEGIIVRFVDGDQDPVQLVTRVPQRDLVLLQTEEVMLQARARACGFVDTRHTRAVSWTQVTRVLI